jgi:hypothetical protein
VVDKQLEEHLRIAYGLPATSEGDDES